MRMFFWFWPWIRMALFLLGEEQQSVQWCEVRNEQNGQMTPGNIKYRCLLGYIINMIQEEESKSTFRRIQQIRLKFNQDYAPYKHFNPYRLLDELNKSVKGLYDIEFVHVRYLMTRNRTQRELCQRLLNEKNFKIDREVNNVFPSQEEQKPEHQFLFNFLFKDAITLAPISNEKTNFEAELEKEMVEEEERKLNDLQKMTHEIMKMYNLEHEKERSSVRAIETFKNTSNKEAYSQNQYDVYAKGIMTEPTIIKLKDQKKYANKPLEIKSGSVVIKLYMNPTDVYETVDKLSEEHMVSSWGQSVIDHKQAYIEYFSTKDLEKKAMQINTSVKILSYVSFKKKGDNFVDSITLTSYLWNEIVLKMVVKMSQVYKIEKASSSERREKEYYLHLTYPPMYYVASLDKEEANSINYMRNWTRVENFVLLNNNYIRDNYFIRYYLFNNTIIRINLSEDPSLGYSVQVPDTELNRLFTKNEGLIQRNTLPDLYKPTSKFKSMEAEMSFKVFLKRLTQPRSSEVMDKIWMIKYLLLVLVRNNTLLPTAGEMDLILNKIEEDLEHIDSYLYIIWKVATNMWGYRNEDKRFYQYMLEESQSIKNMKIKNILKRMLAESDTIVYILRASLTPSGYLFNAPTPEMKGRLLKHFNKESQFFFRVSFNNESELELKNQKYITKKVFRKEMNQIKILDRNYIPLGWSPSQLRTFSLWFFNEIKEGHHLKRLKREYILAFLGNFETIDNPAKRAARIGQSFSASWTYNSESVEEVEIEDRRSETGHLYTDGIGKISAHLIESISLRLQIKELSIIQMRYKGAKGVLTLDETLEKNKIVLRKSMVKYKCEDEAAKKYLDILDWNKYKAGYLNRQIIILLKTLGISDTIFMGLQEEHIKRISSMTFKDCSIFKHMGDDLNNEITNLESANQTILELLRAGFELEKEPFFKGVLETLKKNGYNQLKVKSNIQVQKSARIIGIIDEFQILEENQIYCAVHDEFEKDPVRRVVEGDAIITRNPCLDPADIRKVTCVSKKQIEKRFQRIGLKANKFERFVNCVIFPMKGKFPLTSQISGSDLDGDNFFVCWDHRLIPKAENIMEPHLIDEAPKVGKEQEAKKNNVDYNMMLDFFIDYANYEKLGQIDNAHLVHADRDLTNYANSKICQRLAEIHGKAVDFPKTGYCPPVPQDLLVTDYPDFMEKEPEKTYTSKSILGKLYQDIKQKIERLREDQIELTPEIDNELICTYQFDHSKKDIKSAIKVLKEYERQITTLIKMLEKNAAHEISEFEIYSGNFSIVKDSVKGFGKNRLIATIMGIRKRYFDIFFEDFPEDSEKYESELHDGEKRYSKVPNFFSEEVIRKTQLFYLVSYTYCFPNIKNAHEKYEGFKEEVNTCLTEMNSMRKKGEYCGFVWFVIPKLIISMKMRKKLGKEKEFEEEEEGEGEKGKGKEKKEGESIFVEENSGEDEGYI